MRRLFLGIALILLGASALDAHDLFLKPLAFFLAPGAEARARAQRLPQVGDARTAGFDTVLGYPAELVPLDNPYATKAGGRLRLRTIVDGRAVAAVRARWDRNYSLSSPGFWYVRFIHMVPVTGDSQNYASKWATLTVQVR